MKTIIQKICILGQLCCIVAVVILVGCSGSGDRQAVSGAVTFGDQPLASGAIHFRPVAGTNGPSTGGAIKDGHFEITESDGLLPVNIWSKSKRFEKPGKACTILNLEKWPRWYRSDFAKKEPSKQRCQPTRTTNSNMP